MPKKKVIVDLVVNHTGYLHPWVGEPQYENWFHDRGNITNWNDQQEVEEGKILGLPDLNQANPEVKRYLIDMAKWWIRQTGIDGYRLDTVKHVAKTFWKEFSREIKKEFPDFYLIGKVYDGRPAYVVEYQKAGFDGLVDFPLYYAINDVFGGSRPAESLTGMIEQCAVSYPDRNRCGTFIDNHDVPRFVSQLGNLCKYIDCDS
jgi:alpha-amylase